MWLVVSKWRWRSAGRYRATAGTLWRSRLSHDDRLGVSFAAVAASITNLSGRSKTGCRTLTPRVRTEDASPTGGTAGRDRSGAAVRSGSRMCPSATGRDRGGIAGAKLHTGYRAGREGGEWSAPRVPGRRTRDVAVCLRLYRCGRRGASALDGKDIRDKVTQDGLRQANRDGHGRRPRCSTALRLRTFALRHVPTRREADVEERGAPGRGA